MDNNKSELFKELLNKSLYFEVELAETKVPLSHNRKVNSLSIMEASSRLSTLSTMHIAITRYLRDYHMDKFIIAPNFSNVYTEIRDVLKERYPVVPDWYLSNIVFRAYNEVKNSIKNNRAPNLTDFFRSVYPFASKSLRAFVDEYNNCYFSFLWVGEERIAMKVLNPPNAKFFQRVGYSNSDLRYIKNSSLRIETSKSLTVEVEIIEKPLSKRKTKTNSSSSSKKYVPIPTVENNPTVDTPITFVEEETGVSSLERAMVFYQSLIDSDIPVATKELIVKNMSKL